MLEWKERSSGPFGIMLEWKERSSGPFGIAYEAPEGLGPIPRPPRAHFEALAADGARLECFRWGSAIGGEAFCLEVRRHGVPKAAGEGKLPELEDARPADLFELQSAIDQLVPPGTFLVLAFRSAGPDATYPNAAYHAVRVIQPVAAAVPPSLLERVGRG